MSKNQKEDSSSIPKSIQLAPKYHPKIALITKLENGFTIELRGGEDFSYPSSYKSTLVAQSKEEALKIAEEFLKD